MSLVEVTYFGMIGMWQDIYRGVDGKEIGRTEWQYNQIQNDASAVVAGLLSRAGQRVPFDAPQVFEGCLYLAIGQGQVSWDSTPPVQDRADTTLDTEYFRKAINPLSMAFLDADDSPTFPVVAGPSRMFSVNMIIELGEANGTLREFGLFAGQATAALDSGLIVNWVVHPRLDKLAGVNDFVIDRTIKILILEPT